MFGQEGLNLLSLLGLFGSFGGCSVGYSEAYMPGGEPYLSEAETIFWPRVAIFRLAVGYLSVFSPTLETVN